MALLLPISIIVLNFGMPINNIPQLQFSNRIITLISIIGICLAVFLISFGNAFWHYLLLYGIVFGLFIGYGYLAPIKNCYEHLPGRKGKISFIQVFVVEYVFSVTELPLCFLMWFCWNWLILIMSQKSNSLTIKWCLVRRLLIVFLLLCVLCQQFIWELG